ncbi:MAG: VCBS repeat-containing protein, partial [Kiritimatiellia bacterium]
PSEQFALRARLQAADGSFGPEMVVRYDMPSGYISELRRDAGGAPVFVSVQRRSGQIEIFSLRPSSGGESLLPHALEAYSVPVKSTARALQYARGDFNGDGRGDLAAVDFAGAQIFLYLQEENGQLGAPRGFPSLSDINSIAAADLDRDGRSEILVASATEETAGVCSFKDGKLSYPDPLPLKGKPLAIAAGDVDGDKIPDIVLATRDGDQRNVSVLSGRKGSLPGQDGPATNLVLKVATDDPAQIEVLDINQDGKADLLFLAPSKPLHTALQTGPLAFEEIKDLSGYSRGLVNKIEPKAFATADVNGDGKPEVILTRQGFVRAIRMTDAREFEVVEQYNASSPEAEISAAVFVPVADQPRPLLLLADSSAQRIDVMKAAEGGSYESAELIDLADPQVSGAWVASGKDGTAVFWVGKSGFWRMALNAKTGLQVSRLVTHETDIPDMQYSGVDAADLNGDGVNDLVAFDSSVTRILEFLTVDKDWNIKSEMHFKVFEQDPGAGMRESASPVEPKEGLLKDLTGDGKTDILLYTHDRLLLYPQD